MKVLSPFGPKIAVVKIPLNLVKKINDEVESIIKDKKKLKSNDYSKKLVGQVEQEIELKNKFIKKNLKSFISKSVNQYLKKNLNKKSKNIKIKNLWVVRQFKNDYNPVHWHTGDISGVGYLKVPSYLGNTSQPDKKTNENGKLQLIFGSPNLFSKSTYIVKPEIGDFYLFPNYLMHTVYPFTGTDDERRSVSFNAKVQFYN